MRVRKLVFLRGYTRACRWNIHSLVSVWLFLSLQLNDRPNREEAWLQIDGYKHNAYKKYHGWVAATSAFELGRLPSTSVNARLPNSPAAAVSPSTPSRGLARLPNTAAVAPPSTPPRAQALHVGTQARVPMTPTPARKHIPAPPAPVSAPSTPTGSRKNLLYVYSRGKDTTIYTDS
jgi:hypothetical protein